jgi:hypothetical protein
MHILLRNICQIKIILFVLQAWYNKHANIKSRKNRILVEFGKINCLPSPEMKNRRADELHESLDLEVRSEIRSQALFLGCNVSEWNSGEQGVFPQVLCRQAILCSSIKHFPDGKWIKQFVMNISGDLHDIGRIVAWWLKKWLKSLIFNRCKIGKFIETASSIRCVVDWRLA